MKHQVDVQEKKIKRRTFSDQTKINIAAARKVKIIPVDKSSSTKYRVILVGKTGKTAAVEDRYGNEIFYDSYNKAKVKLKYWGITRDKFVLVSQMDM